jgi:hypothetical protein
MKKKNRSVGLKIFATEKEAVKRLPRNLHLSCTMV